MVQMQLEKGMRALVLVAHPDDETIWMGGTIARHRDVRWTIFVLCRKSDPDRMPKFLRAAKYYGAQGIICDLEDEGIASAQQSIPEIRNIIRRELPQKTFDVLFTHGANGEYGHPRHKGVHLAVKQILEAGELKAKQVFFFAYRFDEKQKIAVPAFSAKASAGKPRFTVELSNKEWKAKRGVIQQLYGFRPHIFENRSCSKIESFSVLGRA